MKIKQSDCEWLHGWLSGLSGHHDAVASIPTWDILLCDPQIVFLGLSVRIICL